MTTLKQFMKTQIAIFDTTMRDGELAPGIKMNIHQKIALAKQLEEMGIDIIEVGYP
jgi:2-isopropylmalate synthase